MFSTTIRYPINTCRSVHSRRTFFSWFSNWNKKLIYPPPPNAITTQNRLYPTYIESSSELHSIALSSNLLLLNFTYPGDNNCNKLTQCLFDVLGTAEKYPLPKSTEVGLANIACDSTGGRELLHTYAIGHVPTVLLLKKQMPDARFVPKDLSNVEPEFVEWLKQIK